MKIASNLELEDFEYELPAHLIASKPLEQREKSRLLVVHRESGQLEHCVFEGLPQLLKPTDLLIINNTKVIPVRLNARTAHGGKIEILLLKPETTVPETPTPRTSVAEMSVPKTSVPEATIPDITIPGASTSETSASDIAASDITASDIADLVQWEAMASPLRKLREGEQLTVEAGGKQFRLRVAGFRSSADGQRRVLLNLGSKAQVSELLAAAGLAPLPPYIKKLRAHEDRNQDLERYQTVFAKAPGAVAAPTAGLHFSHKLLEQLRERGVEVREITLHVGPGTFKPVTTTVHDHKVEEESYSINAETAAAINQAHDQKRRIIAVGTTSCRALESAWTTTNGVTPTENGRTDLYIRPGFKFNVTDGLITNFHLSRSSLLIMVSAFAGHSLIKKAYAEAIVQEYRFYSYGDAMLIL